MIEKLQGAVQKLDAFMKSHGLDCAPQSVPNLKGDEARADFINHFKEVQRLKTQLEQHTDITGEQKDAIERILPKENLLGFRGAYLETAERLRKQRGKDSDSAVPEVEQLDFEFVLFASAVIDYDYIMGLIARFSQQIPGKLKMSREQLVALIQSDAKFMDERADIAAYIATLKAGEGLRKKFIREGYQRFIAEQQPPVSRSPFPGLHPGLVCTAPLGRSFAPTAQPHISEGQRPGKSVDCALCPRYRPMPLT